MLFIPILIIGIALYLIGKKVLASIIFFFFIFDGFQLIPEEYFGMKSTDFALIYVVFLFIWGCVKFEDFIPKNKLTFFIGIYLGFTLFEMLLSYFYYHIEWIETIRTSRQNLFLLSYFIFRRIDKNDISHILDILFCILLVQCCLFIIQVFTGLDLLTGAEANFSYGWLYRCYNTPFMLYFFVFYGAFSNPFKGLLKYITIFITVVCMFLPMHRSLSLIFIFIFLIGFLWKNGMLNSYKNILITSFITVLLLVVGSINMSSRTIEDVNKVKEGEYLDIDEIELTTESTFLFRIAHFYERFLETTDTYVGAIFGLGFMTEDSSYTHNRFDFIIGLSDDKSGEIVQLETSDITWSNFIIRYGILGTVICLSIYVYLIIFYSKKKKCLIAMSMSLYIILLIGISFTCDLLYHLSMLTLPLLCYEKYSKS